MSLCHPLLGRRQVVAGAGALVTQAVVATLLSRRAAFAQAGENPDVAVLQTATSIDNAALAAYDAVLGLAFVTVPSANPLVVSVLRAARSHHADHVLAYDDVLSKLGAPPQDASNPAVARMVANERGGLTDLVRALDLLLRVETVAAHTAQRAVGLLDNAVARAVSEAVAGTEAQHAAVLRMLVTLVNEKAVALLVPGKGPFGNLPPAAGDAGTPEAFTGTDEARPPTEGAVR